jgi:ABC-2 type transport system permease protein
MNRKLFASLALICLAVMFLGVNYAARSLLSGVRLDATQDRLYTLSQSTRTALSALKEPVTFDFYVSRQAAAASPVARAYVQRVSDMLKAYAALSGGRITLNTLDPAPFSALEDKALAAGLVGARLSETEDSVLYFGLVVKNAVDESVVIPFFAPEREASLEYDLTRAVLDATEPTRPSVAVITGLPWLFQSDAFGLGGQPVARVAKDLSKSFDLDVISPGFDQLPPRASVLLIAQPWELSPWQLYLVDQFALSRGRVIVMLDPASSISRDGGGGVTSGTQNLGVLAGHWGFAVQPDVVMDRDEALPVQTSLGGRPIVAPQPLYFQIVPDNLDRSSLITSAFGRGINVGTPGEIVVRPKPGLTFEPLMTTSKNTMKIAAAQALAGPGPEAVLQDWQSLDTAFPVAMRISGPLTSAFATPPAAPERSPDMQAAFGPLRPAPAQIKASTRRAEIIVVGDVDLLADSFYATADGEAADNAAFVLNAVDLMSGSEALIGLRSRAPSARPLVVVETLKANAQARLLEEQQQLETRLQASTQRLEELQAKAKSTGFLAGRTDARLTPAEEAEISRFREDVVSTRQRLRAVQSGVRSDVDYLKTLMIVLNGILIPFLVTMAGLWIFTARRLRASRARRLAVSEQVRDEVASVP